MVSPPSLAEQRAELRRTVISAERRHRVLVVCSPADAPPGVVPALVRALEALGHTVFHLDPTQVPGLAEVTGSTGTQVCVPVVRTVLDTFRPQVLVVCGDGIGLDDAGATECARRGIVTVAMSVSEDDVAEHPGTYDYRVTQTEGALERSRADGVRAALLVPPGIDRSLVVLGDADVPSADVVCLGAAGFPGVIDGLAEQLGGQVSLLGLEHDSTGAVLAAVATGAVVCAPSSAAAGLFEPGTEVIAYTDADDLRARLADLMSRSGAVDELRRRAFGRLVSEHLLEHRWDQLFAMIRADVEAEAPLVGRARAVEIANALADGQPEPRTVLVSGYFGAGNRGDDLLLEALASGLERDLPGAQIVVASKHPARVVLGQGRPAFDRHDLAACDDRAARAGAVVIGPGGLWDDYSIHRAGGVAGIVAGAQVSPAHLVQLPVLVRAHGGDVHVFGMGAGPLDDDAARAVVRFTGDLASSVVVRDERSAELLRGIDGWTTPVTVAPDVCYALALPAPTAPPAGDRYVAVNVRPWEPDPDAARRVLDAVAEVAGEAGMGVVGIPMQQRDRAVMRGWAKGHPEVPFTVLSTDAPLADLVATIRGAQALVSMRLHAALLGHRLGIACVGIAYDPKVTAHFADVGRADQVIGLPVDAAALTGRLRTALATDALPAETVRRVADLERRATASIRELAARLTQAPHPGPAVGRAAFVRDRTVLDVATAPDAGHAEPASRPSRQERSTAGRVRGAVVRRLSGRRGR